MATKKATNPTPQGRKRDQEVLAAATKVFAERGYAASSVQHVADELGILKGSLYHYIDTKEDLLFRLLDQVHEDVAAILEEVAGRDDLDPLGKLEHYVRRSVAYNLDHLDRISIYYHDIDMLSEERRALVLKRREQHNAFVVKQIKAAQEAGVADPSIDAKVAANLVFGTIIWTYRWFRTGRWSRAAVADHCARYALTGVGAKG